MYAGAPLSHRLSGRSAVVPSAAMGTRFSPVKLEAVLGQLRCEVLPPLSLLSTLEQTGSAKNVSLVIQFFLHSNQAKFHIKPYSALETEQNEPNFMSLS